MWHPKDEFQVQLLTMLTYFCCVTAALQSLRF